MLPIPHTGAAAPAIEPVVTAARPTVFGVTKALVTEFLINPNQGITQGVEYASYALCQGLESIGKATFTALNELRKNPEEATLKFGKHTIKSGKNTINFVNSSGIKPTKSAMAAVWNDPGEVTYKVGKKTFSFINSNAIRPAKTFVSEKAIRPVADYAEAKFTKTVAIVKKVYNSPITPIAVGSAAVAGASIYQGIPSSHAAAGIAGGLVIGQGVDYLTGRWSTQNYDPSLTTWRTLVNMVAKSAAETLGIAIVMAGNKDPEMTLLESVKTGVFNQVATLTKIAATSALSLYNDRNLSNVNFGQHFTELTPGIIALGAIVTMAIGHYATSNYYIHQNECDQHFAELGAISLLNDQGNKIKSNLSDIELANITEVEKAIRAKLLNEEELNAVNLNLSEPYVMPRVNVNTQRIKWWGKKAAYIGALGLSAYNYDKFLSPITSVGEITTGAGSIAALALDSTYKLIAAAAILGAKPLYNKIKEGQQRKALGLLGKIEYANAYPRAGIISTGTHADATHQPSAGAKDGAILAITDKHQVKKVSLEIAKFRYDEEMEKPSCPRRVVNLLNPIPLLFAVPRLLNPFSLLGRVKRVVWG